MAAGKISLQANDTRIYEITAEDGAGGNVAITLPKEGGMLTVDTEVVHKTGDETIAGVKTFSNNPVFASGTKIQGDFSNSTISARTAFQTSTVNGVTNVAFIPNGTATQSLVRAYNSSDANNSNMIDLVATSTSMRVQTAGIGAAAQLPLEFWTNDTERMRIDTNGSVGIGTSSPTTTLGKALHIYNSTNDGTPNSNSSLKLESVNRNSAILLYGDINTITSFKPDGTTSGTLVMQSSTSTQLFTNSNGIGYGTGSGGTVTQLTSKSTAVTLNKPCGKVTMNNAALAAGATVGFIFNNSAIGANDTFKVCITNANGVNVLNYEAEEHILATGVGYIKVKNLSASALAEALAFNFTVIKGAIA